MKAKETTEQQLKPVFALLDHIATRIESQKDRRTFFANVKRYAQELEYQQLSPEEAERRLAEQREGRRLHQIAKESLARKESGV